MEPLNLAVSSELSPHSSLPLQNKDGDTNFVFPQWNICVEQMAPIDIRKIRTLKSISAENVIGWEYFKRLLVDYLNTGSLRHFRLHSHHGHHISLLGLYKHYSHTKNWSLDKCSLRNEIKGMNIYKLLELSNLLVLVFEGH